MFAVQTLDNMASEFWMADYVKNTQILGYKFIFCSAQSAIYYELWNCGSKKHGNNAVHSEPSDPKLSSENI